MTWVQHTQAWPLANSACRWRLQSALWVIKSLFLFSPVRILVGRALLYSSKLSYSYCIKLLQQQNSGGKTSGWLNVLGSRITFFFFKSVKMSWWHNVWVAKFQGVKMSFCQNVKVSKCWGVANGWSANVESTCWRTLLNTRSKTVASKKLMSHFAAITSWQSVKGTTDK